MHLYNKSSYQNVLLLTARDVPAASSRLSVAVKAVFKCVSLLTGSVFTIQRYTQSCTQPRPMKRRNHALIRDDWLPLIYSLEDNNSNYQGSQIALKYNTQCIQSLTMNNKKSSLMFCFFPPIIINLAQKSKAFFQPLNSLFCFYSGNTQGNTLWLWPLSFHSDTANEIWS